MNNKKDVYIIYDSGSGGITVLNEIIKQNIQSHFIYFADTKHSPYGNKEKKYVIDIVLNNFIQLKKEYNILGVIMACNTAAILTKNLLEPLLNVKVFSISEYILDTIKTRKKVYLLGTKLTVDSGYFVSNNPQSEVIQKQCPSFAPFIDSHAYNDPYLRYKTTKDELCGFQIDDGEELILACTHFPFLSREIKELYRGKVIVTDPSEGFVGSIKEYLIQTYFSVEFVSTGHSVNVDKVCFVQKKTV